MICMRVMPGRAADCVVSGQSVLILKPVGAREFSSQSSRDRRWTTSNGMNGKASRGEYVWI